MGEFVNPLWMKITGYLVCCLIAGLNVYLLVQIAQEHFGRNGLIGLGILATLGLLFSLWVKFGYHEKEETAQTV